MNSFCRLIRRGIAAVGLASAAIGSAHAGLVTGSWDPSFGPTLPNLSYQVQVTFYVPDACSAQVDGIYVTSAGACVGASMVSARLRLFDTTLGDPNNFFEVNVNSNNADFHTILGSVGYGVFELRVQAGMVVGLQAGRGDLPPPIQPPLLTPVLVGYAGLAPTLANFFGMVFDLTGPQVYCQGCNGGGDVYAETDNLEGFMTTYNDDGSAKFVDGNGRAIGALLNNVGEVVGFSSGVPLPGTLALLLAAVLGMGRVRWRALSA